MNSLANHNYAMQLRQRGRGRPRTVAPEIRENNYKDPNGQYQLSELKPWHVRIVDYMISSPAAKIVDVAGFFNVSPQWIGTLLRTDAFVEYYKLRMQDYQDEVKFRIVNKLQGIASESLDAIQEKLQDTETVITFGQAKDAAELSLRALGYTSHGNNGGGSNVQIVNNNQTNNLMVAEGSAVARAREKMLQRLAISSQENDGMEVSRENFTRVTSSMEVGFEGVDVGEVEEDIEDAVLLDLT